MTIAALFSLLTGAIPAGINFGGKLVDVYETWRASRNTPPMQNAALVAQEVALEEKAKQDVKDAQAGKPDAFNSAVGK